jgi:hypothetical protein
VLLKFMGWSSVQPKIRYSYWLLTNLFIKISQ